MYPETKQLKAIHGLSLSPTTAAFLKSPEKPSFLELIMLGLKSLIYEHEQIKRTMTISKL